MEKVFVVSGHSGAGKTTLVYKILKELENLQKVITCTTRELRFGEMDGKDYRFVSKKKFEEWIKKDMLNEYSKYSGNYYGSLKSDVKKILDNKKNAIFVVDSKGAINLKQKFKNSVLIFIKAPSLEELKRRLIERGEKEEIVEERILEIGKEIQREKEFDYILINDDLKIAVNELKEIIKKEVI